MRTLEKYSATRIIKDNLVLKEGCCDCCYHRGEYVYQAEGFLRNGKSFVVQADSKGYHVLIDEDMNSANFPPGVDEYEMERIFKEALQ